MPTRSSTKPRKLSAKQQAQLLAATRQLADLSTVKHSKKPHDQANFTLFDERQKLIAASKLPWTYKEVGRLLFARYRVEKGQVSDFLDMTQSEGVDHIALLMQRQQTPPSV